MNRLHQAILREYSKTKVVHPSIREIAKKVKCSTETVHKVITRFNEAKKGKAS